jgi:DNA-binding transcriptional LysR family regulator
VGIGYMSELVISTPVANGQLVPLLGDWCVHMSGVYLYYPSRRQVPAPLRAFIDFMRTQSHVLDAARLKKPVDDAIVSGLVSPVR